MVVCRLLASTFKFFVDSWLMYRCQYIVMRLWGLIENTWCAKINYVFCIVMRIENSSVARPLQVHNSELFLFRFCFIFFLKDLWKCSLPVATFHIFIFKAKVDCKTPFSQGLLKFCLLALTLYRESRETFSRISKLRTFATSSFKWCFLYL